MNDSSLSLSLSHTHTHTHTYNDLLHVHNDRLLFFYFFIFHYHRYCSRFSFFSKKKIISSFFSSYMHISIFVPMGFSSFLFAFVPLFLLTLFVKFQFSTISRCRILSINKMSQIYQSNNTLLIYLNNVSMDPLLLYRILV